MGDARARNSMFAPPLKVLASSRSTIRLGDLADIAIRFTESVTKDWAVSKLSERGESPSWKESVFSRFRRVRMEFNLRHSLP